MAKAPKSEAPENIETTATEPVAPIDDGKIAYEIVRPAPPRIALQFVSADQTEIRLTEVQARAEVLAGHIRPKKPVTAPSNND